MYDDNDAMDELLRRVRETYHVPPETPREEMWSRIRPRLGAEAQAAAGDDPAVVDLEEARRRRAERARPANANRWAGWSVAAAALMVLGVGIGRMTAPRTVDPEASSAPGLLLPGVGGALSVAEREYLGETESLLTMVRADARSGRMDPATVEWAEGLLAQTRMLIDVQDGRAPAVEELLLDLELVLVQIVGVARGGSGDEERRRTELDLALRGLDAGEVLPRIQAVFPTGLSGI